MPLQKVEDIKMLKEPWPDTIVEIIGIYTISMMIAESISIHTIETTIIGITDIIRTTNVMTDGITGIHTIKATITETISIIDTIIAMITHQMATGHFI